jgi:hypothetical protein
MIATTLIGTGLLLGTGFNLAYWFRDRLKEVWARTIGPTVDNLIRRITHHIDDLVDNILTKLRKAYGYPRSNMFLVDKAKEVLARVWLRLAHKVGPEQFARMCMV